MINPKIRAKDRIYSELPEELKILMEKYVLTEEEHLKILEDIKEKSYAGKTPVDNPEFTLVVGQTGSGKSNLTSAIYRKKDNMVIIDPDNYKAYRSDNDEIRKNYLVQYAFLTAPDSYLHRDEMIVDAMSKRYNILMEMAPSRKDGLFVDIDELQKQGYKVEICILGVSSLNSLLSVHERYEANMLLNKTSAKLTSINRHDDSFEATNNVIRDVQKNPQCAINVYERGREYPFMPDMIYSSNSDERRFSCPLEALMFAQQNDYRLAVPTFEKRYKTIESQMDNRNAPEEQRKQLEEVKARYDKEKSKDKF